MMFSLIHHDKYTTVLQNDKRIFDILYSFSINIEHKLNAQNVADAMIDALNVVAINAKHERSTSAKTTS